MEPTFALHVGEAEKNLFDFGISMPNTLECVLPQKHVLLIASSVPISKCFRSSGCPPRTGRRLKFTCKAEEDSGDRLAERLKAAESEAQKLRKQLEDARASRVCSFIRQWNHTQTHNVSDVTSAKIIRREPALF